MTLKCFVASAFDHADVDEIYDKAIQPVLRSLQITPLRIDRVEHNEDIDNKIFQFLNDADFCIADLTYARPSVYYESGYASGSGKQIIYIARADHFIAKVDDNYGNLRVHFDLQMKNIIRWTQPSNAFCMRLKRRIRHVIRPLTARVRKSQNEIEAERSFGQLSQYKKIESLAEKARHLLKTRAFKIMEFNTQIRRSDRFTAYRVHKGVFQQIEFLFIDSVTKACFVEKLWLSPMVNGVEAMQVREVDLHGIYVSLRLARSAHFGKYLPAYTPGLNGTYFRKEQKTFKNILQRTTIHILHGISSTEVFANKFRKELETFNLGK